MPGICFRFLLVIFVSKNIHKFFYFVIGLFSLFIFHCGDTRGEFGYKGKENALDWKTDRTH
jgi:hypothetical protein